MFGKKPKRLDSRVRFQHQNFTRKLDLARRYKRSAPAVSDDQSYNVLPKLGLTTRLSQALAILIIAGLVYLIFIPNFLSPQAIQVEGVGGDEAAAVRSSV